MGDTETTATPRMRLARVKLDALKGDPANARLHPEKQIGALQAALDEFDQVQPIVVGPDMTIIGGHGTVAAMRANGATEADVVVTAFTGAKAAKLSVVLNRLGELSKWDKAKLQKQLDEIEAADLETDELELDKVLGLAPDEEEQLDLKEWTAEDIVAHARFVFVAPLELQAKVRAVLVREFPGVKFVEEVIHE